MPDTYGSENPDSAKANPVHQARTSWSKWAKIVLATTSAALFIGGALVLYESFQPASSVALVGVSPLTTTLANSAVSTDESVLLSGQEVLLRVSGKPNLCADDGGSLKPDDSAFTNQPCNPSNPNQLFIYNSKTHQFHSAKKKGLCLDDGGGWAGFTWVRLSTCDVKSADQRYDLDTNTLMLNNPSKDGYCLDDGGGNTAGTSKYTIRRCSTKSENQHFEVLAQASLAAEQKKVLDAVASGAKFLLRIAGKTGMCVAGSSTLSLAACDKQSKNQIFTYDPLTKRIRSVEKLNYCVDDGGGKKAGKTDARLTSCDTSIDQTFVYDRATMQFTQPNKAGLCLDDGSGVLFTTPRLLLRECDAYSDNQHFEYLLQTELTTATTTTTSTTKTTTGTATGTSGATTGTVSTEQTTSVVATLTPLSSLPLPSPQSELTSPIRTTVQTPVAVETPQVTAAPMVSTTSTSASSPSSDPISMATAHSNEITKESPAASATETALVTTTSSPAAEPASYSETIPTTTTSSTASTQEHHAEDPAFASTPTLYVPTPAEPQTAYAQESTPPQYTPDKSVEHNQVPGEDYNSAKLPDTERSIVPEAAQQSNSMKTEVEPIHEVDPSFFGSEGQVLTTASREGDKSDFKPEETHNGAIITSGGESGLIPETEHSDLTRDEYGLVSEEDNFMTRAEPELTPEETLHATSVESRGEKILSESEPTYMTTVDEPELIPQERHNDESVAIPGEFGVVPEESHDIEAATSDHKSTIERTENAVPTITAVDTSLASYADQDWNLLAPSDKTIGRLNTDHSASISADKIFEFLQSIKDRADLEHERMMYRYKRTFECVSAGLKTLATDSVTNDEYNVLVRWMYEHCAAGSTEIVLPLLPPLSKDKLNDADDDVAPLVEGSSADVKRYYVTKLDFYYQIKNHFTQIIEQLDGDAAGKYLRSEEKNEQQKKILECIEKAVNHFGYHESSATETTAKQLMAAVSWVDSCTTKT